MVERTFLESIGKPYSVNAVGSARAWRVDHLRNDPTLPPLMYVEKVKWKTIPFGEGDLWSAKIQFDPLHCQSLC